MAKINNDSGFSVVEALLIVIVVGILGFTGWFVYHARNAADRDYSAQPATTTQATTKKKTAVPATSKPESQVSTSTNTNAAQTEQKQHSYTFNFVDTTGWQSRSPADKSFSVNFGTSQTYGSCDNASGVLMIGMVYLNGKGQYSCGGVKDAVTQSGSSLPLTYIAIGPSESLWDKGDSKAVQVTLSGGQTASRYTYTNTIGGATYDTIEYDVTNQSKGYVAVMHWPVTIDFNAGSYISPDYFDTIVQKTWTFN
jgi:Tfp pilus assembly protein PilV